MRGPRPHEKRRMGEGEARRAEEARAQLAGPPCPMGVCRKRVAAPGRAALPEDNERISFTEVKQVQAHKVARMFGRLVAGDVPLRAAAAVLAAFISLAWLVGWSFYRGREAGGIDPLFPSPAVGVVAFAGLFVVLLCCLLALFRLMDRGGKPVGGALERHPFAICATAIALAWLPYWLAFFPGSLPWDGVRSMNQFTTEAPLENHHPVMMNALYAGLMTVGRSVWSDNFGLFLIVAFQYVVCVIAFALVVRKLVVWRVPRWIVWAALLFFCLCPMWGAFAQAAFKDTLFNGLFCLFVLSLVNVCGCGRDGAGEGAPRTRDWVLFAAASLVLAFARNNGVYLVAAATVVLAVFAAVRGRSTGRGVRKGASSARRDAIGTACASGSGVRTRARAAAPALAVLCVVVVAWAGATRVAWPALGIDVREDKEMLSVPLQQTARYFAECPNEVTDEQYAAIDAVLPADQLASLYNPDLSDPVKEAMRVPKGNMTSDQRNAYFAAWAQMGAAHPGVYVRATVANTYAYFYPFAIIGQDMDRPVFPLYIQGLPINQTFDVHYVSPEPVREAAGDVLVDMLSMPVVRVMFSPALYVLALLALCACATARRRWRALVCAVPFAVLLATVLLGPLNGHLRYIMPIAAALPLIAGAAVRFDALDKIQGNTFSFDAQTPGASATKEVSS